MAGLDNSDQRIMGREVGGAGGIGYIRIRPNVEPNLPLKPTKACFVCIGPISVSKVYGL